MVGLVERRPRVPVGEMVPAGSIGAGLIAGISDLGERQRPDTTFNQPFVRLPSFSRQHPDLVSYGDILRRPAEELDKFNPRFRLRERLTDYLKGQLILPQSRLLQTVYGGGEFLVPVPRDREGEIVTAVERAIEHLPNHLAAVLILHYGLYDGITQTLPETARQLERPVVGQVAQNALLRGIRKLQQPTQVDLIGYRILPKESFGRQVFGATFIAELPDLRGQALIRDLGLYMSTLQGLNAAMFTNPYLRVENINIISLVMFDLSSGADPAELSVLMKKEVASALRKRARDVEDWSRVEAEAQTFAEAQRRARLGEPRNDLLSGIIELSPQRLQELDEVLLEELVLSVRAYNDLRRDDIRTIGELLRLTEKELLAVRNIGKKTAAEVMEKLPAFLDEYLKSQ